MPDNGIVTFASAHDFTTTLDRLLAALKGKGLTVFAVVDHAAGAATANLPLRPTTLVVFGNPAAGTPLMQAVQTAGLDLPLKVLIWQDADLTVKLSYNAPRWIAARHGLGPDADATVTAMTAGLEALARAATS